MTHSGSDALHHLLKFDPVAPGIAKKRLPVRADAAWVAHLESPVSQFCDTGGDIGHLNRKVVEGFGALLTDDEVQLLLSDVEPPSVKREIGPVGSNGHPENIGVERTGLFRIADGQVHVMNAKEFHAPNVGPPCHSR